MYFDLGNESFHISLNQLVIIDEGVPYDISHPFHLHGHNFFVVAMERHAANASHIGAAPYPGNSIRKCFVLFGSIWG